MTAVLNSPPASRACERVAADVMVRNPVSLRAEATMDEAMAMFVDKGIDAAPVIDAGGRPIGVVSRSDLFIHLLEEKRRRSRGADPTLDSGQIGVTDLMTPSVFAVAPATPIARIVREMLGLHVHRLFVVDDSGILIGVITAMDVLAQAQFA